MSASNLRETEGTDTPQSGALEGLDAARLFECALEDGSLPIGKLWEPPQVAHVAELLPQFTIMECIGRGGMGAVYRGRQADLDRGVAVKLLPLEMAKDPEFEKRFQKEMKILAALNHLHIVKVYESGRTTDGHLYFVMELADSNLQTLLEKGPLSPALALAFTSQLCSALKYAHQRGLVHRDIKPANILITAENEAKLADFGLARLMSEQLTGATAVSHHASSLRSFGTGLTGSQMTIGTPPFASPEQQEGRVDHRSDIFALGVTLHMMLTGEVPPKTGEKSTPGAASLDRNLELIVEKAVERQVNFRFQKIEEMSAAVDNFLSSNERPAQPPRSRKGIYVLASLFLILTSFAGFILRKHFALPRASEPAFSDSPTPQLPTKAADAGPAVRETLPAIENPDDWITAGMNERGFGGWKKVGDPILSASNGVVTISAKSPQSGIVSGRDDFSKFTLHIEFSASPAIDAWIGIRVAGKDENWTGYTSHVAAQNGIIAAGHMGADFAWSTKRENPGHYEGGLGKAMIPPARFMKFDSTIDQGDVVWTKIDGKTTSGVKRNVPPNGRIGIFVNKGSLKVRTISITETPSATAPSAESATPAPSAQAATSTPAVASKPQRVPSSDALDPIIGRWRFQDRSVWTFASDGTSAEQNGRTRKWRRKDSEKKPKNYEITFGSADDQIDLVMNDEGTFMEGRDKMGITKRAWRIVPPFPSNATAESIAGEPAEIADFRKTLLTSKWHYTDVGWPSSTVLFFDDGTFHPRWHWNYWIVSRRTIHVQFWDPIYKPQTAEVFTFNEDLTEFTCPKPDGSQRIVGTREERTEP